uniref:LIM homeobox 2 [Chrysemys picta] n=1 Tax=Lepeophtheirus salmonis TaxID=72036 RepID=A0A0K2T842_LEPSM
MTYSPPPALSSESWNWSSSSLSHEAPLCVGCRLRIVDKYYLSAIAQKWHTSCLKCSECGVELENQISCFEKEGSIFCKDDYLRIYANNRQCYRCLSEIQPSDLVIKARHCLFHVDCFRCATCDLLLQKGDLFGMFDDVLYCKQHFEHLSHAYGSCVGVGRSGEVSSSIILPDSSESPPPLFEHYPSSEWGPVGSAGSYSQIPPTSSDWYGGGGSSDIGSEFGYENNNEPPCLKKRRGRKKRKMESFNAYLDISNPSQVAASSALGSPGSSGFLGPSSGNPGELLSGHPASKTKRARTSFKHHQLRIMRGHFQVNQNPDSRELKMLSQKTGLDKKVLQVWFQNARAKWRRVNTQTGINVGPVGSNVNDGSTVLNMENLNDETGDSDSTGIHQ